MFKPAKLKKTVSTSQSKGKYKRVQLLRQPAFKIAFDSAEVGLTNRTLLYIAVRKFQKLYQG